MRAAPKRGQVVTFSSLPMAPWPPRLSTELRAAAVTLRREVPWASGAAAAAEKPGCAVSRVSALDDECPG